MRVSVTTKIFLSLAGVLATFAVVAIYSIFTVHSIGLQLEVVDEGYIPLTKVAAELEALVSKTVIDVKELQQLRDHRNLEILRRLYPDSVAGRVSRLVAQAERIVDAAATRRYEVRDRLFFARVRRTLRGIRQQHAENVDRLRLLLGALERGHPRDIRNLRRPLREGEIAIIRAVRALAGELESRITATVLSVRRDERTSGWVVMALAVLAAAVGLLLVVYAQHTLGPIKDLTEGVGRIASGDYSRRVSIPSRDEIGVLAGEFNKMADSLVARDRALEEEKRFSENIVESLRSAVVVTDQHGRVKALNGAARSLLALAEGDDPCSTGPLGALDDLPERVAAAMGGKESILDAAGLPDGRHLDLQVVPFRDASGAVQGALLIAENVTEKVRTKEQLVKSERLAAVGRIAAQITHEIRNPLSSIGLNAELLGEEVARHVPAAEAAEARHLVASIAREVDRLTAVTEEYLRYARLPRPRFSPEALNDLVEDLLRFLEGELRVRGLRVQVALDRRLPDVEADENQLRQALLNLMRNSCESMREGGTLRVRTGMVDAGVEVTIADTGSGIAPEDLGRVFDPFFSTKEGGTGLGLALTHQIIDEHGGRIEVESEVGRGTTFHLYLPLSSPRLEPEPEPRES